MLRVQEGIEETDQIITRMGEGAKAGFLSPEAMARTFAAVAQFAQAAGKLPITAFATSAVRDAGNREEFLRRISDELGIAVRVLSGTEEARLAYAGASVGVGERALGVTDIGGGSTEIVTGQSGRVASARSFNVGAVRLTDTGLPAADMIALTRDAVSPAREGIRPEVWRGIGGTITTLAAMDQELTPYDPARVHGYPLPLDAVRGWVRRLAGMSVQDRMGLKGIQPERGRVILAGVCVLCGVMEKLSIDAMHACVSDNLRGAVIAGL